MTRIRFWCIVVGAVLLVASILVIRNQVRVYRNRQAGLAEEVKRQLAAADVRIREITAAESHARAIRPVELHVRQELFEMLQPVALKNCRFERFGEANDGGYVMCGNLLGGVQSAYSYGISGYDGWGCNISTTLSVKVHRYDCFDTREPACPGGDTVFHGECVGDTLKTDGGRLFDTMEHQFAKNGDAGKRLAVKIDVEGAEWDSFMRAPDGVLTRIDQMAVEFHRVQDRDEKYLLILQRLKKFFHIAHIHYNNYSCVQNLAPLPAWAFEVLLVNKRLGIVDPSRIADIHNALDAPNNPELADCQPTGH